MNASKPAARYWMRAGAAIALWRYYRVHVGADGVKLSSLLGRARFIRYRDMSLAKREGARVILRAKNGTTLVMTAASDAIAHAFVEDVNDRIAVTRQPPDGSTPAMLRRAGRPVRAWLSAILPPAPANVGYRESAMPSEILWRVLEEPTAPPTARAGAAFALRRSLGAEGRAGVKTIAEACAEPKLRVALEAVASEDDLESVEKALDPLEDEA